jgi:hypothetical protein
VEFCSDFLHICQLGEQDENGIVRLNIDFLICIKYIFLWQNFVSAQLLRNRWAEWYAIFRDDRGYDVVVQHASHS